MFTKIHLHAYRVHPTQYTCTDTHTHAVHVNPGKFWVVCKNFLQFSSVVDIKTLTVEQVFWPCGFIWKTATGRVAMYINVKQCTAMFSSEQRFTAMYTTTGRTAMYTVQLCTAMCSNVHQCTTTGRPANQLNLNNVAGTSVPCSAHSHWHLVARFENLSRKH